MFRLLYVTDWGRLVYSIVEIEEGAVRVERRSTPCPD